MKKILLILFFLTVISCSTKEGLKEYSNYPQGFSDERGECYTDNQDFLSYVNCWELKEQKNKDNRGKSVTRLILTSIFQRSYLSGWGDMLLPTTPFFNVLRKNSLYVENKEIDRDKLEQLITENFKTLKTDCRKGYEGSKKGDDCAIKVSNYMQSQIVALANEYKAQKEKGYYASEKERGFFEKLQPKSIKGKIDENKIAIIIGIEKYDYIHDADFAEHDSQLFFQYAKNILGIPAGKIIYASNEQANYLDLIAILKNNLPLFVKPNKSKVYVFFSGHGLAKPEGNDLYLIPSDGRVNMLEKSSLARRELISYIADTNPESVILFFDTCYSGISRRNESLIPGARPLRIVPSKEALPENFSLFSASQDDEIANGLHNVKHGLFSYYLMKGLEGNADNNDDEKITTGELQDYVLSKVPEQAKRLGRKQTPVFEGDTNQILVEW